MENLEFSVKNMVEFDEIWKVVFTDEELEVMRVSGDNVLENLKFLAKIVLARLHNELFMEKTAHESSQEVTKLMDLARKIYEDIWDIEGTPKDDRPSLEQLYKKMIKRKEMEEDG